MGSRVKHAKQQNANHQRGRAQRAAWRPLAYALVAVVVLGVAGYLIVTAFVRPSLPALAGSPLGAVIDVAADMGGFDQPQIRVKVGQPVTVRLTSLDNQYHTDGGGKHQWAVDELGVNVVAPPLGSKTVTFTPTEPGRYTFYCDICCGGRANPTMQGTLIVEA